jgi:peptide/nickel transport system permease protein
MTRYLLPRLGHSVLALLIVVTLVFFAARLTGDPARVYAGDSSDPAVYEQLREELRLDQPLVVQYATYLANLSVGDLGESWTNHRPVTDVIIQRLPATIRLALASFVVASSLGILLGTVAALTQHRWPDRLVGVVAVFFQAVPNFWLGLIFILVLAVRFDWLPAGGYGGGNPLYMVLPVMTLSLSSLAGITRLTRSATLDVMHEDYVRTATAKGLQRLTVVRRHVLRNALVPVITLMGLQLANLLQGAVVTEQVFTWPGVGQLAVQSITQRDFPVVQGIVLMGASVFIVINLVVDLSYGVIDPRIRLRHE